MKTIRTVLFLAALSLPFSTLAGTIYVGLEDTPHGGDSDYQDLLATITGATLHDIGGSFSNLTPALVNNSDNVFWDNVSGDGLHDNFGNYLLGNGGFSGGPVAPGLQYLATGSGGIVGQVWFSGGSTVTIVGGITADHDTLSVCYVSNCSATLHTVTGTYTFTATQDFELVGVSPNGTYYSDGTEGHPSSFAFAEGSSAPEPATLVLVGGALLGLGLLRRRG